MIVELAAFVALALSPGDAPLRDFGDLVARARAATPDPVFLEKPRAVSNWRLEAARHLDAPAPELARRLDEAAQPPRCVKLNNYWCVKRAGWDGEIASDGEGHVAFASAPEGALVAIALLRRYALSYNLRSAQAILARWAPAQCGLAASRGRVAPPPVRLAALAPRGIGSTLRARWLAGHRPGGAPKSAAAARPRVSIVIDRRTRMIEAPEIAVGMGERSASEPPRGAVRLVSLDGAGLGALAPSAPAAGVSCASEAARVRAYAARAVEGLGIGPDDDLLLFSPDGAAGPRLAPFLRNMARVEIGPLGAREDLIRDAIAADAARRAERPPPAPQPRPNL
ncbi:hypothetical protein [Methylocella sp.]|uniref:hypothetical protein n=1 Tax=Methylocella sp. TaxID=1978226 RepID=UPI0035B35234